MAVDIAGTLYVAASLAAGAASVRIIARPEEKPELVICRSGIVGLAFGPGGNAIVATHTAVYRCSVGHRRVAILLSSCLSALHFTSSCVRMISETVVICGTLTATR